jgi:hypothetical protein
MNAVTPPDHNPWHSACSKICRVHAEGLDEVFFGSGCSDITCSRTFLTWKVMLPASSCVAWYRAISLGWSNDVMRSNNYSQYKQLSFSCDEVQIYPVFNVPSGEFFVHGIG